MPKLTVPAALLEFVENSQIALTVSAPRQPDNPIVALNDSFSRLTGYAAGEVIGRNCRFLQGDTAQPRARDTLRRNIATGAETQIILRNFRKSGEPFDNYLFVFPILGGDGEPSFFVGSQFEIPQVERVRSLKDHSAKLRDGFDQINATGSGTRDALIQCGSLLGIDARDLIMKRLGSLP
jgi:PAS domain S-box-containing protein